MLGAPYPKPVPNSSIVLLGEAYLTTKTIPSTLDPQLGPPGTPGVWSFYSESNLLPAALSCPTQ